MRRVNIVLIFSALTSLLIVYECKCQETVFTLLSSDIKKADQLMEEKNYRAALPLYENTSRKSRIAHNVDLKIARCHYFLKNYNKAAAVYESSLINDSKTSDDVYYYAESLAAQKNYKKAIEYYRKYQQLHPDDQLVIKKLWQLNNIEYIYEDSLHYAVRPVSVNTSSGELCPVPYKKGIAFMSNRKETQVIENIDATTQAPFYRIYYSNTMPDTTNSGMYIYGKPALFNKDLSSKFHAGPLSFYGNYDKMIFVSSSHEKGEKGSRTLQLFFASLSGSSWKIISSFPYNSVNYSITDPSVSSDGNALYFSSDMPGGFGGMDLYKSEYKNGAWTKPINLGEQINTPYDEVFPYLHKDRTLYFSSNGHAGIGGLDIFKTLIRGEEFDEVQNAGYPINSNLDEFGIVIDSLDMHGYFSSNRSGGGYNDDIFEFDMDLQTYPLTLTGIVKYKEHSWSDTSDLKEWPNAKLYLIDNIRNVTVYESQADSSGNFSITIPHFSKYRIRLVGEHDDEHVVSLEIPKHRKQHSNHEIVVIKDSFSNQ
jgi:hypothetical protein